MSVLYGNNVALRYARTHAQHDYPRGSVLSLVTWTQEEESRWFGAKVGGKVKSVESVTVTDGPNNHASPLQRTPMLDGRSPGTSAAYLLSLHAAVMP